MDDESAGREVLGMSESGIDGGSADGKSLGTFMTRDGEDIKPVEEGEVTDEIISNEGSVNRGRPSPDGVGVFEMSENLTSSQKSTCRDMRRRLEIGS